MQQLETELKWPIADRAAFVVALRQAATQTMIFEHGSVHELNIWYERGEKPKGIPAPDTSRRLRITRSYPFRRGCRYEYCITQKGPNLDAQFKISPENNFYGLTFSNPHQAMHFFEFMEFRPGFLYEKVRIDFRFNGVVLSYDTLPLLGDFVEIEGERDAIVRAARLLQLDEGAASNLSYKALFRQWKSAHPESPSTGLLWDDQRHFLHTI